jgi:N-hydroxyarylamine O-acetyltransferase
VKADLRESVLERLGLGATPELKDLYAAWCEHVPWDSAQKRVYFTSGRTGPLPGSSPDEFFETWLAHGCGGTCWAGSLALHALATSLGFRPRIGAGQVMRGDEPIRPVPNHGTVLVEGLVLDSSFLTGDPLPIGDEPYPIRNFRPEGATEWRLLVRDVPLDLVHAWHEATRTTSDFNRFFAARGNDGDDVVGWQFGHAVRLHPDGTVDHLDVDRTTWLVETLGFSEELATSLPEDEA